MTNRVSLDINNQPFVVQKLIISHLGIASLSLVLNQEFHRIAVSADKDLCHTALKKNLDANATFIDAAKLMQLKLRYLTHTMLISKHCRVRTQIYTSPTTYTNVYITPNYIAWFHNGDALTKKNGVPLPRPFYYVKPDTDGDLQCRGNGFNIDPRCHPLVTCTCRSGFNNCMKCGGTRKIYHHLNLRMEELGIFVYKIMDEDTVPAVVAIQKELTLWSK